MPPVLAIAFPPMNDLVQPGPLDVTGWVKDRGNPEPDPASVTIQIDNENPVDATLHVIHPIGSGPFGWQASYSTPANAVIVPPGSGAHVVTVTATDDNPGSTTKRVTVFVGQAPTDAVLTGTCNIKSALPLSSPAAIGLRFTPPSIVEVTSFPPITFPPVNFSGFTLKATVSQVSGGSGTFDPGDGAISIPMVFNVSTEIDGPLGIKIGPLSATLQTTLTTGMTSSPAFNDRGSPLQPAPGSAVVLDGDGTFSTPIFGMTDGAISLVGIVSPHP
jgi:hypothetical protein